MLPKMLNHLAAENGTARRTSTIPNMIEPNDDLRMVENSLLYKRFARQRDEILRYKWIESEKAGVDIGFEKALLGWLVKNSAGRRE
jgi:hypothetical protein